MKAVLILFIGLFWGYVLADWTAALPKRVSFCISVVGGGLLTLLTMLMIDAMGAYL